MLKSLVQSIVGRFKPTIVMVPSVAAPTIPECGPTNADLLQRRAAGQLDQSVRDHIAVNTTYVVSDQPMSPDEWEAKYCVAASGRLVDGTR